MRCSWTIYFFLFSPLVLSGFFLPWVFDSLVYNSDSSREAVAVRGNEHIKSTQDYEDQELRGMWNVTWKTRKLLASPSLMPKAWEPEHEAWRHESLELRSGEDGQGQEDGLGSPCSVWIKHWQKRLLSTWSIDLNVDFFWRGPLGPLKELHFASSLDIFNIVMHNTQN